MRLNSGKKTSDTDLNIFLKTYLIIPSSSSGTRSNDPQKQEFAPLDWAVGNLNGMNGLLNA